MNFKIINSQIISQKLEKGWSSKGREHYFFMSKKSGSFTSALSI